jgi:hypothetical protein
VFALFGLLIAVTFSEELPKELALLWILDGIYLLESGAGIAAQVCLKDSQAFLGATNYNLSATSAMGFRNSNG